MALAAESQFHVLAVDDSLIDRKLIERLLKTSSFLVTTVDSGSKALKFLGLGEDHGSASSSSSEQLEAEVNMVITDYCMPEMTGYDLLKKMKESSALKNIPVVIMSSENVPARINRTCLLMIIKQEEKTSCKTLLAVLQFEEMPYYTRCLEDGAEEFLLKPVKLSDMNKLRPHILKGKCKEQQGKNNNNDDRSSSSGSRDIITTNASSNLNSTKRKAMDEGLSPERKRAGFSRKNGNSLTVL